MQRESGFIKINRKILEWEWYNDANTKVLFFHLLLKANYKETKYRGMAIPIGGLVAGHSALAAQTMLSVMQVRTALKKLEKTCVITIKRTNKFSIISIVKWVQYQENQQANNKQSTGKQQSSNNPVTVSKERKKGRKEEVKNTRTQNAKINFASFPSEPDKNLVAAWFKVRKVKRLVNTQIAIDAIGKKITRAVNDGYTVDQCLKIMVEKSWGGFERKWLDNVVELKVVTNNGVKPMPANWDEWNA